MIVVVKVRCRFCSHSSTFKLEKGSFESWLSGRLVHKAFPDLSQEEREFINSQVCDKCFDQMGYGIKRLI